MNSKTNFVIKTTESAIMHIKRRYVDFPPASYVISFRGMDTHPPDCYILDMESEKIVPEYDVVVVGAGNAGLIAALECQRKGKKTLLIEKHNTPGGCATSFRRGRFEIEASLHELCDVGTVVNPGGIRKLMEELGVKVEWIDIPDCYRVVSKYTDGGEMDVTMPSGIEAYIARMEMYVPGSREKMTLLFDIFDEIISGLGYITSSKGKLDTRILMKKYPNLLITGSYSVKKAFDTIKLPQRCQDILSVYWSYLGVDITHLSFVHYAAMVHTYISKGAAIPKHTSHALSTALTERFRELGGDIYFNTRAERFIFDGDRCSGVETNTGRINSSFVLADINPDIVYGRMIPPSLIPERAKKLSSARRGVFGGRMITSYFCLDKSAEELGIRDYSIFLPGTADSEREYNNILKGFEYNDFSIFLCYNAADPSFSPPGTCICSFTSFGSPVDWNSLREEDYFNYKRKWAEKFLSSLEKKTGIVLRGHIEEMETASPWTFSRYLGAPEGSAYGYETRDWDSMMARMMMLDRDYPVKGLLTIGTSEARGDGYNSTMLSGLMMADRALKDMEER